MPGSAPYPVAGSTNWYGTLKAYIDAGVTPEVNAQGYGIRPSASAATNDAALATLFTDYPSGVGIVFPEVGTYNFTAALPRRDGVSLRGMGFATVLNWTSGNMLAPTTTVLQDWHFADLALTTSGATNALIDLGSAQQGMIYSTFDRCYMLAQTAGASIIKGTNVVNFFGIRFRDCQLWRIPSSTVSAITVTSNSSGMNSITWDDCLIQSQGASTAPFIRLESTAVASYVTGVVLRNIVGEQNAGGMFHGFGVNGFVADNVIDYDQSTYANSIIKLGTGSGGVQSYGAEINVMGTPGAATFTTGGHVEITSGSSHYLGRIMNGPAADPVVLGGTMRRHVAGLAQGVQTTTTSVTINRDYRTVLANGTSITVTLPAASGVPVGREFIVKNINATSCTVASAGGTIDGAATKSLAQFAIANVVSDGANWFLI